MRNEKIAIQVEGSSPDTALYTYIQDFADNIGIDKRPMIIICPGGAYAYTSVREGEPLALTFAAMGYHVAVLRYSTAPVNYPVALMELATSIKLVREHASKWHVDEQAILVMGSSAGGHLAASMGCFWKESFLIEKLGLVSSEEIKPNGMILSYPVITSGVYAHRGSFENLLGNQREQLEEKMSLEKQVTKDTPRAFIWHTFEDGSVPVENSLLFASALREAGVSVEFHLFPHGGHGLALANGLSAGRDGKEYQSQCSQWTGLCQAWLEAEFPLTYGYRL